MDIQFYQELLNSLSDGVYSIGRDRQVTYWNKAAERLSGYSAREVLGRSCEESILRHLDAMGRQVQEPDSLILATLSDGQPREAAVFMHHKYGYRVPVVIHTSPLRGENGELMGAVEVFSSNVRSLNIMKELEALRKEVLTDQLTCIGNRRFYDITIKVIEKSWTEGGVPFGALFVDIDNFKAVNDTFGHPVGDKVLHMVAQTLAKSLRALDIACRWGGEEFLLLLPNSNPDSLLKMGQRQRTLVENSWLEHDGSAIKVTASFGGAVSRDGEVAEEVVNRADKQLYRSKHSGRNCVSIS
ncbi:MAG TPA: GGDEF domain-containing protein [Humidesulfovibrio sp.]|uniref:sensor domain-containing diguanylate cyclase n=1 Tax=Humidesulfovibrio sp. TaxID=2910988 RepID=UPI002B541BAC|nr:GGDEF domain-containing protein [Humidesulfovibrio sp.]HWR04303.1 GGDEF domain-containing protein [Humidesulfovibrio sp.]